MGPSCFFNGEHVCLGIVARAFPTVKKSKDILIINVQVSVNFSTI